MEVSRDGSSLGNQDLRQAIMWKWSGLASASSQKDRPASIRCGEPKQRSDSDCINLSGPDTFRTQGMNVNSQRIVVSGVFANGAEIGLPREKLV